MTKSREEGGFSPCQMNDRRCFSEVKIVVSLPDCRRCRKAPFSCVLVPTALGSTSKVRSGVGRPNCKNMGPDLIAQSVIMLAQSESAQPICRGDDGGWELTDEEKTLTSPGQPTRK